MTVLVVALMIGLIADEMKLVSATLECYCRGNLFPRHPFGARGVQYWPPLCDKRNKCRTRSGGVCVTIIQCPGFNMARGCSDRPLHDWTIVPGIDYYLRMGARLHTCSENNCNLGHRSIARKVCPALDQLNRTHDQIDEYYRYQYGFEEQQRGERGFVPLAEDSEPSLDLYLSHQKMKPSNDNKIQFKPMDSFSSSSIQALSPPLQSPVAGLVNSGARSCLSLPVLWTLVWTRNI